MKSQRKYTVEEVLEIALTLDTEERKVVVEKVQESLINEKEILETMSRFHEKYEATYKALA